MPIYEYRCTHADCTACGATFERLQRLSDETAAPCPTCGQPGTRLISAPSVAMGQAHQLKEKHFSEKGFTQYKRLEKGVYEKTAGTGPKIISDPGD
jgi:putative FmdB family regulatory protein